MLLTLVLAVLSSPRFQALCAFPAQMRVLVGHSQELDLDLPMHLYARSDSEGVLQLNGRALGAGMERVSLSSPLVFEPLRPGRATVEFRWLGLITFRRVAVEVLPEISLVPGGQSIGVILQPDGVLVIGLASVTDPGGHAASPAHEAGVEVGDIIARIAGVPVGSDGQIASLVQEQGLAGRPVRVEVRRRGALIDLMVRPRLCRDTGRYRLGVLVRDMTAGVGTLTFYDPESSTYAALGHMISEAEGGEPVAVHSGRIVGAYVAQIEPGRRGEPGEKLGTFIEGRNVWGDIRRNSPFGIYGVLSRALPASPYANPVPLGLARQVKTGPAQMLTVIEGDRVESFSVEIRRAHNQTRPAAKGLVVQVTDPRLLERTGGIVQGMSGSPLIQDGRLIGAVTHVFVNDPARGYGMYAEWMAAEAGLTGGGAAGQGYDQRLAEPRWATAAAAVAAFAAVLRWR